jgi:hypothetical protein
MVDTMERTKMVLAVVIFKVIQIFDLDAITKAKKFGIIDHECCLSTDGNNFEDSY